MNSIPQKIVAGLALVLVAGCGSPETPSEPAAATAPVEAERVQDPWFEEVSVARGIDFMHATGHDSDLWFPEIVGGGAALVDLDGDDDIDAYIVQSKGPNRLFVNRGDGHFDERTDGSGAGDEGYGMGVAAGDVDNDGDLDLYVTNYGPDRLLCNDGSAGFSDCTDAWGLGDDGWGSSAAFFDYDMDGRLDLFVVRYVNWRGTIELDCYNELGTLDYCSPNNYKAPAPDRLYHNSGDGTFEDVTQSAGLSTAFGNGLGIVTTDFDDDGWTDVFIANDGMVNQVWMNQQGKGFVDEAMLRGGALDEHGSAKAGMGIVSEDLDDDGDFDVLVVNMRRETDSFFRNDGGYFVDFTGPIGLTQTSRSFTRFGLGWVDFDNDGRFDLYQANGRVMEAPSVGSDDLYAEPNLLCRQTESGQFEEVAPRGGTDPELVFTSRAAAFGDFDNDGGIDVLVINRDGPAHLLRNVVPDLANWVRFRVIGKHGRDAYGARLTIPLPDRTLTREVRSAYSYLAANDPRVHVGLGSMTDIPEVKVRWPDGAVELFGPFAAGADYRILRGTGDPVAP